MNVSQHLYFEFLVANDKRDLCVIFIEMGSSGDLIDQNLIGQNH